MKLHGRAGVKPGLDCARQPNAIKRRRVTQAPLTAQELGSVGGQAVGTPAGDHEGHVPPEFLVVGIAG